jgi:ribosomal protein L29
MGQVRKEVARIMTLLRQREIAAAEALQAAEEN